jgi:hypothetical protein
MLDVDVSDRLGLSDHALAGRNALLQLSGASHVVSVHVGVDWKEVDTVERRKQLKKDHFLDLANDLESRCLNRISYTLHL